MRRLLISLCLLTPLLATSSALPAAVDDNGVRIVAIVNDDAISERDLVSRLKLVMMAAQLDDTPEARQRLLPQVLRGLIDERLQLQEAERLKLRVSKDDIANAISRVERGSNIAPGGFDQYLERRGIPGEAVVNQITASLAWVKIIQEKITPRIQVGEGEVDERLASMKQQRGRPESLVSEIFLPVDLPRDEQQVRETALRLVTQIRAGADFDNIARQFSQGAAAATGGDIGWVQQGQFDEAIDRELASMRSGSVSDPVRSRLGYHVLYLRDRRTAFPSVEDSVVVALRQIAFTLRDRATADEINGRRAIAESMRAEIKTCADMDGAIAKMNSPISGNLGRLQIGDLPADIRPAVSKLQVNQISEPITTDKGVLLLMVCERKEGEAVLPDREEIADSIMRQRIDLMSRQYLRDLRQAAYLDVRV